MTKKYGPSPIGALLLSQEELNKRLEIAKQYQWTTDDLRKAIEHLRNAPRRRYIEIQSR